MKMIVEHLSEVILTIAAIALIIGVILAFSTPLGNFFEGLLDKMDTTIDGGLGDGSGTEEEGKLKKPTISLIGDTLIISTPSPATSYDVYVDGAVKITVTGTTLDLSTLGLDPGNHEIYVVAKADGYTSSEQSDTVIYSVLAQLSTPTISLSDNILTITPVDNAANYDVYVNGIATVNVSTTSIDLSAIGLGTGTYQITVKAKATGYKASAASNAVSYTVTAGSDDPDDPQSNSLQAPSISLSGSVLTISTVENATSYDIYVDGIVLANVTGNTYDLSTLPLADGEHIVTVKAKADGYSDSNASAAVTYVVDTTPDVLSTPTISLSGDTLSILPVENATSYDVYVDGAVKITVTGTTLDLSTLGLDPGNHEIYVVAKADGYTSSDHSDTVIYSVLAQLSTPTISLSDNILTITPVDNATSYDVYVDGAVKTNVTANAVDLSKLGLASGDHEVTVKAKADGYTTSDASNGVTYTVPAFVDENGQIKGTWDDIIQSIEDDSYKDKYSIGNYMPLELSDGTTINMQIAAIDGDAMTGGGKAPLTFIAKELLPERHVNKTPNMSEGWPGSELRSYMMSEIWPTIPEEVRNAIVSVDKTYCDYSTGATMTNAEALWVPSYRELGFGVDYEGSGIIYSELFPDDNSRVKRLNGVANAWWTRTVMSGQIYFRYVKTDGSNGFRSSAMTAGIALSFCLGQRSTLETPTITLSGADETLTISPVDNAVNYEIYKDGELFKTVGATETTLELRDAGFTYGTYEFSVAAITDGMNSSAKSAPVSYTFIPDAGLYSANSGFTGSYSAWFILVADSIVEVRNTTTFYRMFAPDGEPEGELWIPDTITAIGANALSGRTSITALGIPSSVTSIGSGAIAGCDSLTTIVYDGTIAQWNAIAIDSNWNKGFLGDSTKVTIKCTDGTIEG